MPRLKIKNRWITPQGGWRYPRWPDKPLTGKYSDFIFGGTLDDLVVKIHEFRIINNLDLGDPAAEAMDFLCRSANGPKCAPANPAKPMPGVKAKGAMVARFISAMIAWMQQGGGVVQEEAERRATICAGCCYNVPVDDVNCFGCFGLFSKIMQVIGDRKTKMDSLLQFCGHCGCSLKIVAFTPMEILNRSHPNADFPEDTGQVEDGAPIPCWRRAAADTQK